MSNTTRAVLFSLLLCPGGGHLFLKRWWRAALFMVPFLVALGYYLFYVVDSTIEVFNMLMKDEIEADQRVVQQALLDRYWWNPTLLLKVDRIVMLIIWLAAAIDVFFLSRRLSAETVEQGNQPGS